MSRIKQIRDDVTAVVAALPAVVSRGITPEATWVPPSRDRSEVTAAELWVSVATRQIEPLTREAASELYGVQVALFDPLEAATEDTQAEADQLLMEAIVDGLLRVRLSTGSQAICQQATQSVLQSVGHWREKRLFTSFIELKYRQR